MAVALCFYCMGFLHLGADFPNKSPWNDWSKMTDEGWYGGAAIHHWVWGHWYLTNSFNPGVAMPVWPSMLGGWFAVTGMSMIAARLLTMLIYGISLVLLYRIAWKARPGGLAAAVVLVTAVNPFCYAFDRLAILEPVMVLWLMVAFWIAGSVDREDVRGQILLGVVLWLLVLTKMTGVALVPAVMYLMWARWGWRNAGRRGMMSLAVVIGTAGLLWTGYMLLFVRTRYLKDFRYLLDINAYRVHLSIVPQMTWVTLRDGAWIDPVLFWVAMAMIVGSVVWFRELWRTPLFGASVIAVAGYLAYVGYHTNFQPRYYLVIAAPVGVIVGFGGAAVWDRIKAGPVPKLEVWGAAVVGVLVVAATLRMGVQTWGYMVHPEYSFRTAAQAIAAIVRADPGHSDVVLSDSGDDLSLWTGLPAVSQSYTPNGVDLMLRSYRPGWCVAWTGWEDGEVRRVGERYRLEEVARYKVFDDPRRQMLVLYRLTPLRNNEF